MIAIVVQARMGSRRFHGKVMKLIEGKPLLYYLINQLKHCRKVSKLIIATIRLAEDDKIVEYVKACDVDVYRGSSEDVLDRYYQCAKEYDLDVIVRVSADYSLIDYNIVDQCIMKFYKK